MRPATIPNAIVTVLTLSWNWASRCQGLVVADHLLRAEAQACTVSVSARDTTSERSSLHTALLTSGTSAHSMDTHLLCAPRDRITLALRTERSRNTCSATMLLSCCVFLGSLLCVGVLVSNPPLHRSGHGCTVGFDRDPPV